MNLFEDLVSQASQLTVYDITKAYTQAKNIVMNISESEAKVNEATTDEPWGASTVLMREISDMTFNFQQFNEVMPCIYSRFMDKEAKQWRQIYKALQLLEYLLKNGSERVVDDARSHVGTIKMLRNFHYVDDKGKDQGINVRNRSIEIVNMLGDMEKIREERRKARGAKQKYGGLGSDQMQYGSRASTNSSMGQSFSADNIGRGGSSHTSRSAAAPSRQSFDEYDAGEDEDVPVAKTMRRPSGAAMTNPSPGKTRVLSSSKNQNSQIPVKKEIDLFSFDDDDETPKTKPTSANIAAAVTAKPIIPSSIDDTDDFDDFVTAPSASTAPAFSTRNLNQNISSMYASQAQNLNQTASSGIPASSSKPYVANFSANTNTATTNKPTTSSTGGFDDLFSFAVSPDTRPEAKKSSTMASLATENTRAQIWAASNTSTQKPQPQVFPNAKSEPKKSDPDDLFFGL